MQQGAPASAVSAEARTDDNPRELRFADLRSLEAELDRIDAAIASGTARSVGNWTVGQNLEHCSRTFRFSIDGFTIRVPSVLRWGARTFVLPGLLGDKPMKGGIRLPSSAGDLLPPERIADAEGMLELRRQLARLRAGERMDQPSPVFGKLTHEQWTTVQLKHCALHLGRVRYPGDDAGGV